MLLFEINLQRKMGEYYGDSDTRGVHCKGNKIS